MVEKKRKLSKPAKAVSHSSESAVAVVDAVSPNADRLAQYVQPGTLFSVWASDYTSGELHTLRIDAATPNGGVVFTHLPTGQTVSCDAKAISGGSGIVFLSSEGTTQPGHKTSTEGPLTTFADTPPFLLSRHSLALLRAGQPVSMSVFSASLKVRKVGIAQTSVRIHDVPFKVPVLHAQDVTETDWSPVDVYVLDHPTWPLLLKLEFGGECELSLFEITPKP